MTAREPRSGFALRGCPMERRSSAIAVMVLEAILERVIRLSRDLFPTAGRGQLRIRARACLICTDAAAEAVRRQYGTRAEPQVEAESSSTVLT